jgi:hypothetical protein
MNPPAPQTKTFLLDTTPPKLLLDWELIGGVGIIFKYFGDDIEADWSNSAEDLLEFNHFDKTTENHLDIFRWGLMCEMLFFQSGGILLI